MPRTVADTLAILRQAFPIVGANEERGVEFVAARLDELPDEAESERNDWLDALPTALEVYVCDDPDLDWERLVLFVFAVRSPIVVFFTQKHEDESDELLERLMSALHPDTPEVWLFDDPRPVRRPTRPGLRSL